MFYISDNKKRIVDHEKKVVGSITSEGRFTQEKCDPKYNNGLSALELEQISEIMQREVMFFK